MDGLIGSKENPPTDIRGVQIGAVAETWGSMDAATASRLLLEQAQLRAKQEAASESRG